MADLPLLTYSVTPSPLPLQASPEKGAPSMGALNIVVSNGGDEAVTATEIRFVIPVGDPGQPDALSLTDVDSGFGTAVQDSGWTLSYESDGRFVARPDGDGRITTQGLGFTISNIQISRRVGTSTLSIFETASTPTRPSVQREARFQVAKFPCGFYAGNLQADRAFVHNGETATLTWEGSPGAAYTLKWEENSCDVTTVHTWTTPPLAETTNFVLEVQAQEYGSTVQESFEVNVTVANPTMRAHSLTVENGADFGGDVLVRGELADGTGPVFPRGGIILWSGSIGEIPRGWLLCDGQNGTPDLRDRFVLGAGGSEQPGSLGDATTHTHPIAPPPQSFTSSQDGTHSHLMPKEWYPRGLAGGDFAGIDRNKTPDPSQSRTQDDGSHSHRVTVAIAAFTSGPDDGSSRPPWYALAYLMKS